MQEQNTQPDESQGKDKPLEELLAEAQAKLQQQRDSLMRAVADAENARKRAQAEATAAQKYAVERFAEQLLPVVDSLQAALASENTSREALRQRPGDQPGDGRALRPPSPSCDGGGRSARLRTEYRGLAHAERLHAA